MDFKCFLETLILLMTLFIRISEHIKDGRTSPRSFTDFAYGLIVVVLMIHVLGLLLSAYIAFVTVSI